MLSFVDYRKSLLRKSLNQASILESVDLHFDLLKLNLLKNAELPQTLSENFLGDGATIVAEFTDIVTEANQFLLEADVECFKNVFHNYVWENAVYSLPPALKLRVENAAPLSSNAASIFKDRILKAVKDFVQKVKEEVARQVRVNMQTTVGAVREPAPTAAAEAEPETHPTTPRRSTSLPYHQKAPERQRPMPPRPQQPAASVANEPGRWRKVTHNPNQDWLGGLGNMAKSVGQWVRDRIHGVGNRVRRGWYGANLADSTRAEIVNLMEEVSTDLLSNLFHAIDNFGSELQNMISQYADDYITAIGGQPEMTRSAAAVATTPPQEAPSKPEVPSVPAPDTFVGRVPPGSPVSPGVEPGVTEKKRGAPSFWPKDVAKQESINKAVLDGFMPHNPKGLIERVASLNLYNPATDINASKADKLKKAWNAYRRYLMKDNSLPDVEPKSAPQKALTPDTIDYLRRIVAGKDRDHGIIALELAVENSNKKQKATINSALTHFGLSRHHSKDMLKKEMPSLYDALERTKDVQSKDLAERPELVKNPETAPQSTSAPAASGVAQAPPAPAAAAQELTKNIKPVEPQAANPSGMQALNNLLNSLKGNAPQSSSPPAAAPPAKPEEKSGPEVHLPTRLPVTGTEPSPEPQTTPPGKPLSTNPSPEAEKEEDIDEDDFDRMLGKGSTARADDLMHDVVRGTDKMLEKAFEKYPKLRDSIYDAENLAMPLAYHIVKKDFGGNFDPDNSLDVSKLKRRFLTAAMNITVDNYAREKKLGEPQKEELRKLVKSSVLPAEEVAQKPSEPKPTEPERVVEPKVEAPEKGDVDQHKLADEAFKMLPPDMQNSENKDKILSIVKNPKDWQKIQSMNKDFVLKMLSDPKTLDAYSRVSETARQLGSNLDLLQHLHELVNPALQSKGESKLDKLRKIAQKKGMYVGSGGAGVRGEQDVNAKLERYLAKKKIDELVRQMGQKWLDYAGKNPDQQEHAKKEEADNLLNNLREGVPLADALEEIRKGIEDFSERSSKSSEEEMNKMGSLPAEDESGEGGSSKHDFLPDEETLAQRRAEREAEQASLSERQVMDSLKNKYFEPQPDMKVNLLDFLQRKVFGTHDRLLDQIETLLVKNDHDVNKVIEILTKQAKENANSLGDEAFDFLKPTTKPKAHHVHTAGDWKKEIEPEEEEPAPEETEDEYPVSDEDDDEAEESEEDPEADDEYIRRKYS